MSSQMVSKKTINIITSYLRDTMLSWPYDGEGTYRKLVRMNEQAVCRQHGGQRKQLENQSVYIDEMYDDTIALAAFDLYLYQCAGTLVEKTQFYQWLDDIRMHLQVRVLNTIPAYKAAQTYLRYS